MSDAHTPAAVIPAPLRAALALFEDTLADVRFPDVDAEVLRAQADRVAANAEEVRAAREALATAEAALADERAALGELATRALAYARIYAEGRPELRERLDAIAQGAGPAPAKKRGRPRKREQDDADGSSALPPALPFEPLEAAAQ